MGFFANLFKTAPKSIPAVEAMECHKYSNWTRDQLLKRVIELEQVSDNVSDFKKRKVNNDVSVNNSKDNNHIETTVKKQKRKKEFDFSKYNTRFIALKFAYLGWGYNGLAVQKEPTPLPTVEGTILEAMNKCKFIPSMNPQDCNFSRCGRTDKGVSAMSQVISLNVRSNLTDDEQKDPLNDEKEVQYVNILNQILPSDIRISEICLRPTEGFDARFSCQYRHYKYLFDKKGLDLERMSNAAKLYEGEHDFRNFCKLDGSKQITNYKRTIISAKIMKVNENFYCFDLIGSAFLWHQVRCMMANLFLIGQELEEVSLISDMLNIEKVPRKPVYDMASDVPLILYDCKFPDMEWIKTSLNDYKALKYGKTINALVLSYAMKAAVSEIFQDVLSPEENDDMRGKTTINVGDGKGKVITKYQRMLDRQVMDPVDIVNKKYIERKQRNKIK